MDGENSSADSDGRKIFPERLQIDFVGHCDRNICIVDKERRSECMDENEGQERNKIGSDASSLELDLLLSSKGW